MGKLFPQSFFVVATFQLIIRADKAYVSIHYITDEEVKSAQTF